MNGKSGIFCGLDDINSYRFHRRPGPERVSAWIRPFVVHAALTKNALPSGKTGGKAHPVLERRGLHLLDKVKELKLIRVMTGDIGSQDGPGNPS